MKINLLINGEKKQLEIKENISEDERYITFLKDIKNLKNDKTDFNLIFTDDEDEKIMVKDKFDFEYMVSLGESGDLEVLVEDLENENLKKKVCDFKKKNENEEEILKPNLNCVEIKNKKEIIKEVKKDNLKEDLKKDIFKIENKEIEKTLILDDHISLDSNFVEGLDKKVLSGFIEKKIKKKTKKKNTNCEKKKNLEKEIYSKIITQNPEIDRIDQKLDYLNKHFIDFTLDIKNKFKSNQFQTQKVQKKSNIPTIHKNFYCDSCDTENFKGKRYICLECKDFDLCEKCEKKNIHEHNLLRTMTEMSAKEAKELRTLYKANFGKKIFKKDLIKSLTANKLDDWFYDKFVGCYKNLKSEETVGRFEQIFKPL